MAKKRVRYNISVLRDVDGVGCQREGTFNNMEINDVIRFLRLVDTQFKGDELKIQIHHSNETPSIWNPG